MTTRHHLRRLLHHTLRAPHGADRGSLSPYFAIIALAIFMIMGLVVDGGGALNAANRATSLAQEAARDGGQQIDAARAIQGTAIVVDPQAAQAAAQDYLTTAGVTGTVRITDGGQTLQVSVHDSYRTHFAVLLGWPTIDVTGTAEAHLQTQAGS